MFPPRHLTSEERESLKPDDILRRPRPDHPRTERKQGDSRLTEPSHGKPELAPFPQPPFCSQRIPAPITSFFNCRRQKIDGCDLLGTIMHWWLKHIRRWRSRSAAGCVYESSMGFYVNESICVWEEPFEWVQQRGSVLGVHVLVQL